jgi:hypothetical protein
MVCFGVKGSSRPRGGWIGIPKNLKLKLEVEVKKLGPVLPVLGDRYYRWWATGSTGGSLHNEIRDKQAEILDLRYTTAFSMMMEMMLSFPFVGSSPSCRSTTRNLRER